MKELIEKGIKMRELQKRYFNGERDFMTLKACKQAEREFDALLANHTKAKVDTQKNLFE